MACTTTPEEKEHQAKVLAQRGVILLAVGDLVGRIARRDSVLSALRVCFRRCSGHLCAGAPDTPQIAAEVEGLVAELQATRNGVILISEMSCAGLHRTLDCATVLLLLGL